MKTILNQRRARPCLQLWHLAGVAPTLVAALAFPGTAKAAIDRTPVQHHAEPPGAACSALRIEDLEALTELGCVPTMPPVTATDAASFVLSEPHAPSRQPPPEATDIAARCDIWTSVPDLDADVAVPSYCNAPPQAVLAAPSLVAPVVQRALQAVDQPRLDDAAVANGFYAVDDFYAQSFSEDTEQVAIAGPFDPPAGAGNVEQVKAPTPSPTVIASESSSQPSSLSNQTPPSSAEAPASAERLNGAQATGSMELSERVDSPASLANDDTNQTALGLDDPQSEPAVRDSVAETAEPDTHQADPAVAKSVSVGLSDATAPSDTGNVASDSRQETAPRAEIAQRAQPAAAIVRAASAQDDVKNAATVSDTKLSITAASAIDTLSMPAIDALAMSGPALERQDSAACATEQDVELDSAMPTYCVAALQTIVAARTLGGASTRQANVQPAVRQVRDFAADIERAVASKQACVAVSEDLADSAMPSYCVAPEQTILADRSQAANAQVLTGRTDSTTDQTAETAALPDGLLGAKIVASEQLSETRGGFETTDRGQTLRISFGIERAVFVNGALVSTSTLALDGLARMTNVGAGAPGASVRSVGSTANVVRNGADNVLSIAPQDLPAGTLILQNSLSNQRLDANTVVNAVVEASGLLRATRLEAAMREATTGALRR